MDTTDHRYVMAELDTLRQQVVSTIRRFEAAGVASIMKDDYVALHVLEHRIMEVRLAHARAMQTLRDGKEAWRDKITTLND